MNAFGRNFEKNICKTLWGFFADKVGRASKALGGRFKGHTGYILTDHMSFTCTFFQALLYNPQQQMQGVQVTL